jgi:hypothetical protein
MIMTVMIHFTAAVLIWATEENNIIKNYYKVYRIQKQN